MNSTVTLPERQALFGAVTIPANLIRPNPWNRTINERTLPELAESIRNQGLLQPVLVRTAPDAKPGAPLYELIAGERRWRASQLAGLAEVPALVRDMDDLQVIELMLVENLQREDLHPLDEAAGYDRLLRKDQGPQSLRGFATVDELAERIGKSRSYIIQRLTLLKLCESATLAFREGELSFSLALRIARLPSHDDQAAALKAALDGWGGNPMTARDLDAFISDNFMLELDRAPFKITDATLVPEAGSCRECPKRTGASPDLFADVKKGDTCTDSACHARKVEAHRDRVKAEAEAKGMQVITGAAAKKIVGDGYGTPKGYLALDRVHHALDANKPLAKLLGKADVKPVLIENPRTHELVAMVPEAQAVSALKANGVIKTAKLPTKPASQRADEEKRDRENAWRWAVAEAIGEAARGDAGSTPEYRGRLIARLALLVWDEFSHDTRTALHKLLGWPPLRSRFEPNGAGPTAEEYIGDLADAELCRYLTLATVIKRARVSSYQLLEKPAELLAVAGDLGVDAEAIKASLAAARRTVVKAKKTAEVTPETALAGALKKASAKASNPAKRPAARYCCPDTLQTWSGRGLQPKWLKAALAEGKKLADFEVGTQATSTSSDSTRSTEEAADAQA